MRVLKASWPILLSFVAVLCLTSGNSIGSFIGGLAVGFIAVTLSTMLYERAEEA